MALPARLHALRDDQSLTLGRRRVGGGAGIDAGAGVRAGELLRRRVAAGVECRASAAHGASLRGNLT